MRIVHILSNWKWTERAEPAVELALAQRLRGESVTLICGRPPPGEDRDVAGMARQKGLESVRTLSLPKHLDVLSVRRDVQGLRHLLRELEPDVIHCHMPNAHLLAAWARGNRGRPLLIRSCYEPAGPEQGLRARFLYRRWTDGAVVLCEAAARAFAAKHHMDGSRVCVAEPAVDLARFDPERPISGPCRAGLRTELGIPAGDFVIGVVSRIRESRRLDLAIGALAALARESPRVRLMVVGRGSGTAVDDVVVAPARRAGVEARVALAGYCQEDRLVAAYRSMDVLVYPTPGTDKSCRTVREALASAVPVVASRTGFLPVLIDDGVTGFLAEASVDALAGALRPLLRDAERLAAMRTAALAAARARFDPALQGQKTVAFYERLR